MSRKFASLFAAVAIAVASVGPAAAQDATRSLTEPGALSIPVAYGDLDLTRPEGVKVMTVRIERALKAVCGNSRHSANAIRVMIAKCRTKALSDAIADINEPLLTAYYNPAAVTQLASR